MKGSIYKTGKIHEKLRKTQFDTSSAAQRRRAELSVIARQGNVTYRSGIYNTTATLSKTKSFKIRWQDVEAGQDRTLTIPLDDSQKIPYPEREIQFTEVGFQLVTYEEGEVASEIVYTLKRLLSLQDGIYIKRMWEIEYAVLKG